MIYIHQNKPNEVYFQHDMAYDDFTDLPRRTAFDRVLRDKAFNSTQNSKRDE